MPGVGKAPASVGHGASATTETTHTIGPALAKAGTLGALLGLGALVARSYLRHCRRSSRQRKTAGNSSSSKEGGSSQQPRVRNSVDLECSSVGAAPDAFESPFAPISQQPLCASQELPRMASAELLGGFLEGSWKALGSEGANGLRSATSSGRSDAVTSGGASGSSGSARSRASRPACFDSATSCGNVGLKSSSGSGSGSGSGLLLTDASTAITDVTKLPDSWNIVDFTELEIIKAIGEGSFGQVFLARYCQTPVAVKMMGQQRAGSASSSVHERETMRQLSKEAGIMSMLRHPNCTQYLGVVLDPPCLLMEFCSRRSVDAILAAAHTDPKVAKQLSWARLLNMAADAAKGLLYLHSRHIVHRDLKSANLLVDSHWHVKVADFNLSKAVENCGITSTVCITNPRWLSPEVLQGQQAQQPSDVWAYGTVLWELLTWQLPFEKMNPFQIIMAVTNAKDGSCLPIPEPHELPAGPLHSYDEYVEIMKACWARDPAKRPTMDIIVTRLLALLSTELRRASSSASGLLQSAGSMLYSASSQQANGSGPLPSPAASGTLKGLQGRLESADEGSAGSGSAGAGAMLSQPSATETLLAAGHCTVANAGLSQMDSQSLSYPFNNPQSFFARMRSELND